MREYQVSMTTAQELLSYMLVFAALEWWLSGTILAAAVEPEGRAPGPMERTS